MIFSSPLFSRFIDIAFLPPLIYCTSVMSSFIKIFAIDMLIRHAADIDIYFRL